MSLIKSIICLPFLFYLVTSLLGCKQDTKLNASEETPFDTAALTYPDHIIVVWFENKGFDKIIGAGHAPYIHSLAARGTLFTNMYALTHPSYPNYVSFFAGQPNGVKGDACINSSKLITPNLYTVLKSAGKTFAWYSEDLPYTGSKVCRHNNYVERHNPTTIFANVPDSINKRFADFPDDYKQLENVVCVTPNLMNDMHDGTIEQGDAWLKYHFASLVDWCTTHNSIFVIYFDESDTGNDNRIPVIAVGERVKAGYQSNTRYDHYNWTKTICSMFHAPNAWTINLLSGKEIYGCWK
ncbi:MAG: hypothetical protein ICV51_09725 [Flavisolibacter sp.]|nr:hypothetical protein [Flavisolibacter sp.]